MQHGYTPGPEYPNNPLDYQEPTEFRYRIESDNLPESGARFAVSRLFTDTYFETEQEGRATAQLMADEMGVAVDLEVWTINGWNEPFDLYETVKVQPSDRSQNQ